MSDKKYFPYLKEGSLVYIISDNADCGMGVVLEENNFDNGECFYIVYSMRDNKCTPYYPYELELVRTD